MFKFCMLKATALPLLKSSVYFNSRETGCACHLTKSSVDDTEDENMNGYGQIMLLFEGLF